MSAILGLFAKWPAPGAVKTRLGVPPHQAAHVARAFLLDTLTKLESLKARVIVAFSPPDAHGDFDALLDHRCELQPQSEGDLGARLEHFLAHHFDAGATKVVALGADSPTLPIAYVEKAFTLLDSVDVVLGPATDGGYYLLGARRLPPVFADIPWSSATVLRETIARLRDSSWKVALLTPWYDVDTPESWAMLKGHVAAMRRAGSDPGLAWTEPFLAERIVPHANWWEELPKLVARGITHITIEAQVDRSPDELDALADSGLLVAAVSLTGELRQWKEQMIDAARLGATLVIVEPTVKLSEEDVATLRTYAESRKMRLSIV
jgi:hypothetical protein